MASTRKTKQRGRAARHNIRISFLNKKNPRAKPSISAAKTRQLLTEIQAFCERSGVAEAEGCTMEGCGGLVRGLKSLAAQFGASLTCQYTCKWFYSQGGGWQKECYVKCNDGGLTVEATLG